MGLSPFIIHTDGEASKWFLTSPNVSGKLLRWRLRVPELDFEVVHRDGIRHQALDALSSLKTEGSDKTNRYEQLLVFIVDEPEEQQDVET